jgi:Cold shock proteins
MKGKVKFYSEEKGYGFITADDKEYFVHSSGLNEPIDKNDDVEFDVEQGDRGPKAVNVKKAKADEAEESSEESSEETAEETTEEAA